MSMLSRVRPDLAVFRAYVSARGAGVDAPIRLNANESPWDGANASSGCNRYPDPQPAPLRARLAALYGVDPARLWIGRGSDEAIDLLLRGFCRAGRDNIVTPAPTFGMYRIGAQLQGAACRELALDADDDFALDPQRLLDLTDADTKLVVVCSPNNPTGTLYHDTLAFLADRLRGRALVLVDEAYVEFAGVTSASALIDRYENIVVLRTLSKAHALAGARVGALIAREDIAAFIGRIAAPYPLPSPSVALALSALEPSGLQATRARIAALNSERERVAQALTRLSEVRRVWPSAANFVLARFADARAAFARALAAGVVVRDVSAQPGLADCLRITIGTPDENDALLGALRESRRSALNDDEPAPTRAHRIANTSIAGDAS
jgi:histidinol-phosphate aminotransferase